MSCLCRWLSYFPLDNSLWYIIIILISHLPPFILQMRLLTDSLKHPIIDIGIKDLYLLLVYCTVLLTTVYCRCHGGLRQLERQLVRYHVVIWRVGLLVGSDGLMAGFGFLFGLQMSLWWLYILTHVEVLLRLHSLTFSEKIVWLLYCCVLSTYCWMWFLWFFLKILIFIILCLDTMYWAFWTTTIF